MFFESKLIKTDVTSVRLINGYVLAGIGNFLNVFDKNGNFIEKIQIFDGHKIHGIEIDEPSASILLYGGCYMQTLTFDVGALLPISKLDHQQIKDWILTASWLKNKHIAVVVMLNKLIIYKDDLTRLKEVVCDEKCILYSAFICYDDPTEELVVLSGTVFGEILIWKVSHFENEENSPVLTKLEGHKGVIFSISYNKIAGYICSSSDDRSSILWSIENKCVHTELRRPVPKITLQRKIYGHQSRVFRCVVTDEFLVTAGEDSLLNVWNFEGELIRKIETHQGGPVWALHCKNDVIVSGGGDCGVLLLPLRPNDTTCTRYTPPENQIAKRIGILCGDSLVVVTEEGALYHLSDSGGWTKIGHHENLKSYNLLQISPCRKLVSLSGYHGEIYIYKATNDTLELLVAAKTDPESRIYSFHWLTCTTYLTCQHGGLLTLWCLYGNRVHPVTTFDLPQAKDLWSSAACQASNGRYIVGDRRGNIYVYTVTRRKPVQVFKRAHNHLGVTQLYNFNDQIVSLGRNGNMKTFSTGEKLVQMSNEKMPFVWLVALVDRVLLTFSGDSFVVWDVETRRTLFEHVCGGGHRSWDFQKKENTMKFVYVKDRALNVVTYDAKKLNPVNIVPGFHTKTINALQFVKLSKNRFVLMSGSEDTNLRICLTGKDYFSSIRTFKLHLSSIRSVRLHRLDKIGTFEDYLMFSGGGRGQIICWKLSLDPNNIGKSVCSEENSYYEKASGDELSESEIRIMDMETLECADGLLLFAASSDGNVKVFQVCRNTESANYRMNLLTNLFSRPKCVTRICTVRTLGLVVLIAMSTDGNLTFWEVSSLLQNKKPITPFKTLNRHQSGIAACCHKLIKDDLLVFLSGGDDASVVLTLFRIENNAEGVDFVTVATVRDSHSHCACVTGVFISGDYFLTTSVDQKLLVFKWRVDEDKLFVEAVDRYNSAVADVQGLGCDEEDDCFNVFLYGKGVEYVRCVKSIT